MRRARVALLVTTQDRYELAYMALTTALSGIDLVNIDLTLLWLDGSTHPNAVAFFEAFQPDGIAVEKVGGIRGIGPAGAIQHGMNLLTGLGEFDWIGMFESDCYFFPDWLQSSLDAVRAAEEDGLRVGAVTPLTNRNRLLYQVAKYGVTEVLPAGCALFRPAAWAHVPPSSIGHMFRAQRLCELWKIPRAHPSPNLGWDWIFAVALFHGGGYESITTAKTRMLNCAVPEHFKSIPPGTSYADEFLESGVSAARVPRVRDETGWQQALEQLKSEADCALIAPSSPTALAYVSMHFENGWYPRESDPARWWRWSEGEAAINLSNRSRVAIKIQLTAEILQARPEQTVAISLDETRVSVCDARSRFLDTELNLEPGQHMLRFLPSLPPRQTGRDARKLSFAVSPGRR